MFPEALAKDHILSWSNKGDLVFDPFAGSGTTLKMAQLMGRNYLGFEIAEEYIPLINKRLRQKPIDHFLSYSSEANASSSANAESLIGIKRGFFGNPQIPNGTSLNSDIKRNLSLGLQSCEKQ